MSGRLDERGNCLRPAVRRPLSKVFDRRPPREGIKMSGRLDERGNCLRPAVRRPLSKVFDRRPPREGIKMSYVT